MIIGIGTDMVDCRRIQALLNRQGERAIQKLMTPKEIDYYKNKPLFELSFAKVFAAKEALVKAIGVKRPFSWHDAELCHEPAGRPFMKVYRSLAQETTERIKSIRGIEKIETVKTIKSFSPDSIHFHLSLTDEPPYAFAVCVAEALI